MRIPLTVIGLIAVLAFVIAVSGANPGEVTLVSPQKEYQFLTGETARITIGVSNTHGHDVTGTLSVYRTLAPTGEGSGAAQETHDSQTTTRSIYRDMQSLPINAGSSADQASANLRITFEYPDEGVLHTVTLDDIRVRFTKEPSDKPVQAEPRESTESVQPHATTAAPGTMQGQQGGSAAGKAVSGQLGQDTGALKSEIEKQAALEESWKEALTGLMHDNSQIKSVQAALGEKGYSPANTSVKPLSNDSGSITTGYSSKSSGGCVLSANIVEREIKNITVRSDRGNALPEILLRNETFRQYERELGEGGFIFRDAEQNITAGGNRVTIVYLSPNGTAQIGAMIAGDAVSWITLDTAIDPKREDVLPMAILAALIVATGTLIFWKRKKKIPVPDITNESGSPVSDYRREAEKILDLAVVAYGNGDYSGGYAAVARALRFTVSHQLGHGAELTNMETRNLVSRLGNGDREIIEILSRCSLVAFAGASPDSVEFDRFVAIVRRIIITPVDGVSKSEPSA